MVRESNLGHQLLLSPAECCPMFAPWTAQLGSWRPVRWQSGWAAWSGHASRLGCSSRARGEATCWACYWPCCWACYGAGRPRLVCAVCFFHCHDAALTHSLANPATTSSLLSASRPSSTVLRSRCPAPFKTRKTQCHSRAEPSATPLCRWRARAAAALRLFYMRMCVCVARSP